MLQSLTIWKLYRRREQWDYCPLCGTSIKWVRVDEGWVPCDDLPVLFEPGIGRLTVVKHHRMLTDCRIYNGQPDFMGKSMGLVPHVFNCAGISRGFNSRASNYERRTR